MKPSPQRRTILLAAAALPFAGAWAAGAPDAAAAAQAQLAQLERSFAGRLGVAAINTAGDARLDYRADERFPMCSTIKVMLAGAILARSGKVAGLLQRRISYTRSDLVTYSPITEQHLRGGMTVTELCAAALRYSDNTAANLLMKLLGGPAAVTAYARAIGDRDFLLERWETELNTCIPGDPRDTTTPGAMALSLCKLALEETLAPAQRRQLWDWMRGNTTGAARIRAGVPADWQVADKTGTGDYGTANDIGVLWPARRAPVVLAIYTSQGEQDAEARSDVIAAATRIVAAWVG
ncbi:class A beta-lactamase [Janthinobacterium sp.]|uniref:class A beta-lactamase n=1 Tax=Janthinobacterium sp. TaxID=1871054 RepID=UPI00293D24DA|nr:class A beta-lactamase [Janthinobacterium sp.]